MPPAAAPRHSRVIVLGSGPAGYTAAIYTARAMLEPVLIAGFEQGGQLMITTDVENYPGFAEPIQGPWLMDQMRAQAEHVGATLVSDHIVEARLGRRPFELLGDSGQLYTCDALIIATGAKARWLGLPSEEEYKGFGVSACATCDGFFFRGKPIAVIGGGDSAMEEALFLTRFASKVTLLHRRDAFRASKIMLERAIAHPNIELRTNTVVDEVLGVEDLTVKGLRLRDVTNGATSELEVEGMFLGIGHVPNAKMFTGQLDLDEEGYIRTRNNVFTTHHGVDLPGIYACGDVQDRRYRQAITAAGTGCMAALEVEKYLEGHGR